ncbi:class A beta-lactamase [Methylolobus aquaticus]
MSSSKLPQPFIHCTRRQFLVTAAAFLTSAPVLSRVRPRAHPPSLVAIEAKVGGRVGVFALDTGTGRSLANRPDERFALCSTFKWVLAAAILAQTDRVRMSLSDRIAYGPDDLIDHSPITKANIAKGSMTLDALAAAAVTDSDNTAANLLLEKLGGPAALTAFVRSVGDPVTRLDRNEPALNSNEAGDARDTTSPRAMVGLVNTLLCGQTLAPNSRDLLLGWLRACKTGGDRLRAGLPRDWVVGDKTGSGRRGAVNDVAIAFPPHRAPILIAAYLSGSSARLPALAAAHADIGRWVAHELA